MRLLLATANQAKGREMRRLLGEAALGLEICTLADLPAMPAVDEDGATFEANALLKARTAAARTGWWALADDSGLAVDCLGGAPGVHSARYCGRHGDDEANNRLLLERLAGVPLPLRTARFVAAVALAAPDGQATVVTGECPGLIALAPRGQGGFGYDPLFLLPELGLTMAELSGAQKDAVSHRGRAFERIVPALRGLV